MNITSKSIIRLLIIIPVWILCLSCEEENADFEALSPDLQGDWELTEVLADPGDGSGRFQAAARNNLITISRAGSFFSRQGICGPVASRGYLDKEAQLIVTEDCTRLGGEEFFPSYYLEDGNLIISYACIEACLEKYVRK